MIGPARRIPRRRAAALFALLVTAAACGSRKSPALPTAGGAAFPDAAAAYTEATAQCRTVRTLSAELGLSGRVAGQKLRGHILGGFAEQTEQANSEPNCSTNCRAHRSAELETDQSAAASGLSES